MKKSIEKVIPKRPGRPATGKDPVRSLRLSDEFIDTVDAWAAQQEDEPGRSEAIRRLVELGLTVKAARQKNTNQKARAKEMANSAIDKLIDSSASADDQTSRKQRLLKGPEEFREVRVDRRAKK